MESDTLIQLIEKQKELGKKILHFGSLAGWPHVLASTSRDLGIDSENWIHVYKDVDDLDRRLPYDKSIFNTQDKFLVRIAKTLKFLQKCPSQFCLVHYHSTTLLHREYHFLFEGSYLRRNKVPMVLSLGGGEARLRGFTKNLNKFYYKDPNFLADLRIKLRWLSWQKTIAVCATDPEMAMIAENYFDKDKIAIFRQPVQLQNFPNCIPLVSTEVPLLLHVPTSPEVKGTAHILQAVENLKKKGLRFEFKLLRQLTQKDFYKVLSTCDIYIDELRCGAHGVTAVESMAMGKPTISYIRNDLLERYPDDLPIVNANPETIESILEQLILDAQWRANIGIASRKYVEKYHDARIVIDQLAAIYLRLLKV